MNKESLRFSSPTPVWFVSFPTGHTRPLIDVIQECTGTKADTPKTPVQVFWGVCVCVCVCVRENV